MVEQRFGDGTRFCIDRTEVTQAAYCTTPEGVLHLSGNVAEWTAPCGQVQSGELRCLVRGGGYADTAPDNLRCEYVEGSTPVRSRQTRSVNIGFRCCKDL